MRRRVSQLLSGIVLFLFGVPVLVAVMRHRVPLVGSRRARLEFVFGVYLLMLTNVVLFPLRVDPGLRADDAVWDYASFLENWVNLTPFASIDQMLDRPSRMQAARQIGGNMLLLAPLGALLPVLRGGMRRPAVMIATIMATALGIEVTQYLARIARLSLRSIDVDDVILNIAGGVLGFIVWAVWSVVFRPHTARSDRTTACR